MKSWGLFVIPVLVVAGCAAPPPPLPPPPPPIAMQAPLPPPPPIVNPGSESYAQQYGGPRPRGSYYKKKSKYVGANCKIVSKRVPKTSSSGKQVYRVTKYRVCR